MDQFEAAQQELDKLLSQRNGSAAAAFYVRIRDSVGVWNLSKRSLLKIIDLLASGNRPDEAVPFLEEYLQRFEDKVTLARLKLAQILLEVEKKPDKALYVLKPLAPERLEDKEAQLYQKLRLRAEQG